MNNIPIKVKYINGRIGHTLIVADGSYTIWSFYKEGRFRNKYLNTMNNHLFFFSQDIHAHAVAFLIALYRLLETRKDTISFPTFVSAIKQHKLLPSHQIDEFQKRITKIKPTWLKINNIRNNIFGHMSLEKDSDHYFAKSNLSSDELAQFIGASWDLLTDISIALRIPPLAHGKDRSYSFMIDIMESLESN